MSLELNKCPICLRSAVDYRHLELIARFAPFINLPRCALCFGIPPSHNTPENRSSREEIKHLIDLVNYHLERSDKTYYDPVNWRAITFALQVHQNRFQPQKPFLIPDKLGFPQMDPEKLQELLNNIEKSKIYHFQDIQDEINLVLQHQQVEIKLSLNQLTYQDIPYFLKCGFTKEELFQQLQFQLNLKEEERKPNKEIQVLQDEQIKAIPRNRQTKTRLRLPRKKMKKVDKSKTMLTRSSSKNQEGVPLTMFCLSNMKKKLQKQQKYQKLQKVLRHQKPKVINRQSNKLPQDQIRKKRKYRRRINENLSVDQVNQLIKSKQQQLVNGETKTQTSEPQNFQQLYQQEQKQQLQQVSSQQQILQQKQNIIQQQKPIITYFNELTPKQLFGNSNFSDEIILIKSINPRKLLIGQPSDLIVQRTMGDSISQQSLALENDKQKNDMKLLYNIK